MSMSIRALRQIGSTFTRSARITVPRAAAITVAKRQLSSTVPRRGEAASDVELAQVLTKELEYEREEQTDETPEFLQDFNKQGLWKIQDERGSDEVVLERTFGNEKLRLMFSIADLQAEQPGQEEDELPETEEENEEEEQDNLSFPIRASLTITKSTGPGALNIDMVCEQGDFVVDNLSYYKDAKLATDLSVQADWTRRGLYVGPQFDTLDASVQEAFDKYLKERGVDQSLALFLPEYADHKEQKEYIHWIDNVRSFAQN